MKTYFEAKMFGFDEVAYAFYKHVVAEDGTEFRFFAFIFDGKVVTLADAIESPDYIVSMRLA